MRQWVEKKVWDERTSSSSAADAHLITGAIVMCGHEGTAGAVGGYLCAECGKCGLPCHRNRREQELRDIQI